MSPSARDPWDTCPRDSPGVSIRCEDSKPGLPESDRTVLVLAPHPCLSSLRSEGVSDVLGEWLAGPHASSSVAQSPISPLVWEGLATPSQDRGPQADASRGKGQG